MHTNYDSDSIEGAIVGAFVSGQAKDGVYKTLYKWAFNSGINNRNDLNEALIPHEIEALKSQFPEGVTDDGKEVFSRGNVPKVSFMPAIYQTARSAVGGALEAGYGLSLDEDGNPTDSMDTLAKKNPNKRKPRNKDARALKLATQLYEVLTTGPFEDEVNVQEQVRKLLSL